LSCVDVDEEKKEWKDNMVNHPDHAFMLKRNSRISEGDEATEARELYQPPMSSETLSRQQLLSGCLDANRLQTKAIERQVHTKTTAYGSNISSQPHILPRGTLLPSLKL
jgi:hypothetical protein